MDLRDDPAALRTRLMLTHRALNDLLVLFVAAEPENYELYIADAALHQLARNKVVMPDLPVSPSFADRVMAKADQYKG